MKRNLSVAALVVAIGCPLAAHAQSVTIIGEGTSGAARNTTGVSASKNTIRQEDPGATTVGAGAIPSTAGRSDGAGVGGNTATTAGGSGAGSTGTLGTTGTPGTTGGITGSTGTTGSIGAGGTTGSTASSAGAAAPTAGGGGSAGR